MQNVFKKSQNQIDLEVKGMEKGMLQPFTGFYEGTSQMNVSIKSILKNVDKKALMDLKSLGYQDEVNRFLEMVSTFERFHKFFESELFGMKQLIKKSKKG